MTIGHHVDVSNLTDDECSKIINVISKDIVIRNSEKERAAYLNKKFEDLRRELLIADSRRKKRYSFDDYCLICGKHLFTFCCFLHRGKECISCEHFCCTSCRKMLVMEDKNVTETFYLCNLCVNKRLLKYKTSEWFYELFQKRFKRFGSAKILRAIYKQRKSIEPRVITLLALCRMLQPSRINTMSTSKTSSGISISQDDNRVSYSTRSSQNEESFEEIALETQPCRRRFLSESEVTNLKESSLTIEGPLESKANSDMVETVSPSDIEDVTKVTCEMKITENNDDNTQSKTGNILDEWITKGFETREDVMIEMRYTSDMYVETSESTPLLSLAFNQDESIDKEVDFNEGNRQMRM